MNIDNQLPPVQNDPMMPSYRSLVTIKRRKEQLRKQIHQDDAEIRALWKTLFRKSDKSTKGMRVSGLMSTGAGVLDGLILGWKLYRKYKGFRKK